MVPPLVLSKFAIKNNEICFHAGYVAGFNSRAACSCEKLCAIFRDRDDLIHSARNEQTKHEICNNRQK
jgi:hypothetical protein